jgi:hypothetical protein
MIHIAILVPICSRNRNYTTLQDIPLLTCLYNSFLQTKNANYTYDFFIGFDDDDLFYNTHYTELLHHFPNVYKLEGCQHAPATAWNKLAQYAYTFPTTTFDYFFQVGDDIVLKTNNWTTVFVEKLKLYNDVGVVGPCNLLNYSQRISAGKPYVIENAFVSRKHLDIFGFFFHPNIKNWYCDDWLTQVYKPYFSEIQTDILCTNTIYDIRYIPELCNNITTLIEDSRKMLKHKKIFSYCIYGQAPKYCLGMLKNIEQITEFYPDFEIWITLGNDVPAAYIDKYKAYANVFLIYTEFSTGRLMAQRFFPIDDPTVDLLLVRDADSRFTLRDMWCINNFINSPYKAFTIRDHKYHFQEIMAGQCGLKRIPGLNIKEKYKQFVTEHTADLDYYYNDQDFIIKNIYYPYKSIFIAYTSFNIFPSDENIINIPLPHIAMDDFCGNVVLFDEQNKEYTSFDMNGLK